VSLSGEFTEETSTSAAIDVAKLYVLYCDLPPYQPEPTGDLTTAEEMRDALPTTESIAFPFESVGKMIAVSLMPSILVIAGLKVITSPTSLMFIVEPTLS